MERPAPAMRAFSGPRRAALVALKGGQKQTTQIFRAHILRDTHLSPNGGTLKMNGLLSPENLNPAGHFLLSSLGPFVVAYGAICKNPSGEFLLRQEQRLQPRLQPDPGWDLSSGRDKQLWGQLRWNATCAARAASRQRRVCRAPLGVVFAVKDRLS